MVTFQKLTDGQGLSTIKMTDDSGKVWFIPADSANSDYQDYLDQGGTP